MTKYIMRNPNPFNVYTRYLFHFDGCPFLEASGCSIYDDRPYICRLFPLRLIGLFDDPSEELRLPVFTVRNVEKHSCYSDCLKLNKLTMEFDRIMRGGGTSLKEYLASLLLDKKGFSYAFGQRRIKGGNQHLPIERGNFTTLDIEVMVGEVFHRMSGFLPEHWKQFCETLSNDEITLLTSDKFGKKTSTKTGKRMKNLERFKPTFLDWWKKSH